MLPRLYAICDADVCAAAGWTLVDFAAACMDGGATLLQLRAKRSTSADFLRFTETVLKRAAPCGATIIVNDRADVARLAGAGGVHVGQDDLGPSDVRRIVGGGAVVGLSTHSREQLALAVEEPITYVAVGPVFGTTTKETGYAAVGFDLVREASAMARAKQLPVVAIGGITLDRAAAVIDSGATSVAVITDLLTENAPEARVRAFLDRLSRV